MPNANAFDPNAFEIQMPIQRKSVVALLPGLRTRSNLGGRVINGRSHEARAFRTAAASVEAHPRTPKD